MQIQTDVLNDWFLACYKNERFRAFIDSPAFLASTRQYCAWVIDAKQDVIRKITQLERIIFREL